MSNNQVSADFQKMFSNGQGIYKKINSYRDNGTHADEWLVLLRILLPISAAFTLAFGCALHYNLALPYAGTYPAGAFALLFTIFIELSKIIAGKWFFRQVFFGMWQQGLSSMFAILCGGILAAGAFFWSYYNSTAGVKYLSSYLGETHIERKIVEAKTQDVDTRLLTTENLAKKGLGTQWKGNTTRDGQRIAKNASAAIAEQERQKTIIMERAAADQQQADQHRTTFITTVGQLLSFLGGKMEWFQLIILLGMVANEKTLWHRMTGKQNGRQSSPTNQNSQFYNAQPIGFNVDQSGQVRSAPPPRPVNGLPNASTKLYHNVVQTQAAPPLVGSDEAVKHYKTLMGREIANLKNENGKPYTVANRLHGQIIEFSRVVLTKGFDPKPIISTEMYLFLETQVFPVLESQNRPYPYSKEVLKDLRAHIDESEYQTRKAEQQA